MPDPSVPWLAAGFIVVWLVLGAYLVRLHRAQRRLDSRLDELATRRQHSPPATPESPRDGERASPSD